MYKYEVQSDGSIDRTDAAERLVKARDKLMPQLIRLLNSLAREERKREKLTKAYLAFHLDLEETEAEVFLKDYPALFKEIKSGDETFYEPDYDKLAQMH